MPFLHDLKHIYINILNILVSDNNTVYGRMNPTKHFHCIYKVLKWTDNCRDKLGVTYKSKDGSLSSL